MCAVPSIALRTVVKAKHHGGAFFGGLQSGDTLDDNRLCLQF